MTHDNHDHGHADCLAMFEKLSAYIDNELDPLTCKDIETHAEHCIACQACLATLKKTVALCKEAPDQPPPEAFSQRLKQLIVTMAKKTATEATP
jgi:anti-sigma factor RsiW